MNQLNLEIFIPLLAAHLLTDFSLQSDKSVRHKRKFTYFATHIMIAGLTSYLLLGQIHNWIIPCIILVSHGIIDLIKLSISPRWVKELRAFTSDQIAHVLVIVLVSSYATKTFHETPWWSESGNAELYLKILILVSGCIASTRMASVIIKKILPKILNNDLSLQTLPKGLPQGGHYIGYLERILLFTFVMSGQLPAVGFLVASKSIFRFNDIKGDQQEKTEYILVGTLLSFTTGILSSIFFKQLWQLV